MNENRVIGTVGSRSVIVPLLSSQYPAAQAVNAFLTFLRLAFPLELLALGALPQIAFIVIMPFTFIWMVRSILRTAASCDPRMIQAGKVALAPFAFLMIEGIFEPDFGSFARHFSMVSPLVFSAMALINNVAQEERNLRGVST
jgi:hypothetical protein